jgi:RNA-binding protein (KH domain)
MKDLVEYIVKSIVAEPDKVNITEENNEEGILLIKLEVALEDKGRVIGRQGRVAEAMRTLLRVKAAKNDTRVRLEIV